MWPDATKIESEDFGHMQAVWQRDVVAVCIAHLLHIVVHISEYSQISKAFLSLVAAFVPLLGIQG